MASRRSTAASMCAENFVETGPGQLQQEGKNAGVIQLLGRVTVWCTAYRQVCYVPTRLSTVYKKNKWGFGAPQE